MGASRLTLATEQKLQAALDFITSGKIPRPPAPAEAPEMNEELKKLQAEISSLRAAVEALTEKLSATKLQPPSSPSEPEKVVLGPAKEPGTASGYPA